VSDSTTDVDASRFARFRGSLTRRDWTSLGGMYGFIILLHVVGFGVLLGFVVPNHYQLGGDHPVFSIGVGILATRSGFGTHSTRITSRPSTTRRGS
jgi:high-affinity nickel-transport protein